MAKNLTSLCFMYLLIAVYGCAPRNLSPSDNISFLAEGHVAARYIVEGDFRAASKLISATIGEDASNSEMHFLNGLLYHIEGRKGSHDSYLLARHGYLMALRIQPLTPRYLSQVGILEADLGNFDTALRYQTHAALLDSSLSQRAMLAEAAYSAGYVSQSLSLYESLVDSKFDVEKSKIGAALSAAACDNISLALHYASLFAAFRPDSAEVTSLKEKILKWKRFQKFGELLHTDIKKNNFKSLPASATISNSVVFDVLFIELFETEKFRKGLNLLKNLSFTIGADTEGTSGLSFAKKTIKVSGNSEATILKNIYLPSINYTLNIINSITERAYDTKSTTLVASFGEESSFFSGLEINASAVNELRDGSININKNVGLNLKITPTQIEGDKLKINLELTNSNIIPPSDLVTFDLRVDISTSTAIVSTEIGYGETLLVGGFEVIRDAYTSDGVPGVREIPGLNLLFSEKSEVKSKHTLFVLVTPKKILNNEEEQELIELGKIFNSDLSYLIDLYISDIGKKPLTQDKCAAAFKEYTDYIISPLTGVGIHFKKNLDDLKISADKLLQIND